MTQRKPNDNYKISSTGRGNVKSLLLLVKVSPPGSPQPKDKKTKEKTYLYNWDSGEVFSKGNSNRTNGSGPCWWGNWWWSGSSPNKEKNFIRLIECSVGITTNTTTGRSSRTLHINENCWKCWVLLSGSCWRFRSEEFYPWGTSAINFWASFYRNTSTPIATSPPAPTEQTTGVPSPRSSDHGNLRNIFPESMQNLSGKQSVVLTVSNECHLLSKLV